MKAYSRARFPLPVVGLAVAAFVALNAQPVSAQSPVVSAADTLVAPRDTATGMRTRIDTVRVTVKRRAWWRRERDLVAGNRFLEKELARYDRRIVELEKKLDSLKFVAAARWKEARELEAAALATRERRLELERRVAFLEAADSVRTRGAVAAQSPR